MADTSRAYSQSCVRGMRDMPKKNPPISCGLSRIVHAVSPGTACSRMFRVVSCLVRGRYEPQGLFFETPNVSWRGGQFVVELPQAMEASRSFARVGTETTLGSRDAAFEFETRDAGALAALYRDHVRQVLFLSSIFSPARFSQGQPHASLGRCAYVCVFCS